MALQCLLGIFSLNLHETGPELTPFITNQHPSPESSLSQRGVTSPKLQGKTTAEAPEWIKTKE